MIDVYTANTPNGVKVPIALEELGVAYQRFDDPFFSAATQSLNDADIVAGLQGLRQFMYCLAVDEHAHVRPHAILLVDHAKAYAVELPIQIGEHLAQRRSIQLARELCARWE